jgi:hypothetical protein
MEHRLGTRHAIDLAVYLRTWGSTVSAKGRLKDLSVSGAFIATQLPCRPLLQVSVLIIPDARTRRNNPPVEGLIVRLADGGIAIEWEDLQPQLLMQVLPTQDADELLTNNIQCSIQ